MEAAQTELNMYDLAMLLDFYGQLLTENQFNCLDLHVNQDLSMSEIAEELGISRQGVYAFIDTGRRKLAEYEAKLGLYGRFNELRDRLTIVKCDIEKGDTKSALSELNEVIANGI